MKAYTFPNTDGQKIIWSSAAPSGRINGYPLKTNDIWVDTTLKTVSVYDGSSFVSEGETAAGVYKWQYDATDYVTLTITNAGTATFNHVSGGTAGFIFSDTVTLSPTGATANLILTNYGRISTSTYNGAALTLDATYNRGNGWYARWNVTDWAGIGSSLDGLYCRVETNVASADKELRGIQSYAVSNDVNTGGLKGILAYAYVKGTTARTVGPAYGVHGELSFDAGASTKTITTEAAAGLLKITGGVVDTYTKLHGLIIRAGDMDGQNRTYGNGLLIEDDSSMTGTITWTTGLNITAPCTNDISLQNGETISNATNGILAFSGVIQQGATATAALSIGAGTSATPATTATADKNFGGFWTQSTATSGDSRGLYWRHYLGGTIATTGYGDGIRAFTTVTGTGYSYASGLHATMQINAAATVTGSGSGIRATLAAAEETRALVGALSAAHICSDIATGNTLPTVHGFMRFTDDGAVRLSNLMVIPVPANGTLFAAHITQTMTHSIRIIGEDGTPYYIMCTNAATNRS